MSAALPQVIATGPALRIGSRYAPDSLEQRSSADGSYSYRLPPQTRDGELLQRALLIQPPPRVQESHPADRWIAVVAYVGCVVLLGAGLIARYWS